MENNLEDIHNAFRALKKLGMHTIKPFARHAFLRKNKDILLKPSLLNRRYTLDKWTTKMYDELGIFVISISIEQHVGYARNYFLFENINDRLLVEMKYRK